MKTLFSSKTVIALAVAVAAAAGYKSLAHEQPIPPPTIASDSALPANVPLGSPVGQVFKLAQAGVDISVIQNYISNCPTAFNLDADKIIALTDAGLPGDLVNAMFTHDKTLPPVAVAPPVAAAAPEQPAAPVASAANPPPAPPPNADLDLNQVSQTLTPYGSWVQIDGYGRCWRPSVVVYDSGWRPYCDRGQWVYTDCGWYWNSDYAWGVTFHYGRWFNHPNYGWCWWPDTVWAPSWVTWRSDNSYCGWAPLPPYTAYQPGIGFTYHGGNVALSFGFGLASSCYTFVTIGNFCEHHPRYYCASPQQVTQIYNQTTIINNFNSHNHTIVNNGVSVTVIGNATRHPIQPVPIGSFGNGDRHGWRGQSVNSPGRHFGSDASDSSGNRQFTGPGSRSDRTTPSATSPTPGSRHDQRDNGFASRGDGNAAQPPAQPATTPTGRQNQRDQRDPIFAHGATSPSQPVPAATAPAHNPSPNNGANNGKDFRQIVRSYSPAATTPTAPAQPTRPNNWGASNPQPSQPRSDFREQPRQINPQPAYTPPSVAVERPQRSETRQNVAQAAPHYVAPSAPAMSAPAQSQPRSGNAGNGNGNNFGRSQAWMAQNR